MNVYKSSFLIIGKGVTYKHCKKFFNENSITYVSIDTHEVAEIKDMKIMQLIQQQSFFMKKMMQLIQLHVFHSGGAAWGRSAQATPE